jgi:hypothetical protein
MSNRAKARPRGRVTARPVGQEGVSIDRDGPKITFSFFDFRSAFTVEWSVQVARDVYRLLGEALEERQDVAKEFTRGTGLIVSNRMPS